MKVPKLVYVQGRHKVHIRIQSRNDEELAIRALRHPINVFAALLEAISELLTDGFKIKRPDSCHYCIDGVLKGAHFGSFAVQSLSDRTRQ